MFGVFDIERSVNDKMSSLTVTVTGTDPSALVCDVFPPLELTDGECYAGMLDFTTYNSIPNVESGRNDVFPVLKGPRKTLELVKIPTGVYEISDIEMYLKKALLDPKFALRPNNNTLKCELYCSYEIDFGSTEHTIGTMLGFSKKRKLEAYILHTSDAPVNINKVNVLEIRCNAVQGSYKTGRNEHILHSFYPTVEPGFKIVETPRNVIYFPLNVLQLRNVTVSVHDQDGDIVNFQGEVITARIHLKRA